MRWLLDEMMPHAACDHLRALGHDAVSVRGLGLGGSDDGRVFTFAVRERRMIVTENVADYALLLEQRSSLAEPSTPVVFVRKSDLPSKGALARHLARALDRWATETPTRCRATLGLSAQRCVVRPESRFRRAWAAMPCESRLTAPRSRPAPGGQRTR